MSPQETRTLESGEAHRPWVETPFTVSNSDVVLSVAIPFSVQSFLDEENSLQVRLAGVPEERLCPSSRHRYTARPVVQLDTQGRSPVLVANAATDTGGSDSDYIKVDYEKLIQEPTSGTTTVDDGSNAMNNDVVSLDSMSTLSGAASTGSSPSSCQSLLDPAYAPPSISLRYASLHRQLQEAGLAGLGDGTTSIDVYHR